jgi:hypothetical protein
MLIRFCAFALAAALATSPASPGFEQAQADESPAYVVEVTDVSSKVGEPAVLHATLRIRDGYRVLQGYNNRVIELSSFDDGVAFERRVVRGPFGRAGSTSRSACGPLSRADTRSTAISGSATSMAPTSSQ